jgi:glucose/arabinose dehydrogenase
MRSTNTLLAIGLVALATSAGCPSSPDIPTPSNDNGDGTGTGSSFSTTLVASGLDRPVYVTAPPGDTARLFILEQHTGHIRILDIASGKLNSTPFLTIDNVSDGNEEGLLGLAFPPDYSNSGRFYVNYTQHSQTIIARGVVSSDADVAGAQLETLMAIDQPFSNHNGGWMGFGPDGMLYIASGDGGSANDPQNHAQALDDRLGKILRVDVSAGIGFSSPSDNPFVDDDGDDTVWAYGLRNAWRCSFDRSTGDLYMADVGQEQIEEINIQPADSNGGENYGWSCKEGTQCTTNDSCDCSDALVDPVFEYTHGDGCSITGGYVYRGSAIPSLEGMYFYADFCSDQIWTIMVEGLTASESTNRTDELRPSSGLGIDAISSFGEDAAGELYICDLFDGEVFKIVPAN